MRAIFALLILYIPKVNMIASVLVFYSGMTEDRLSRTVFIEKILNTFNNYEIYKAKGTLTYKIQYVWFIGIKLKLFKLIIKCEISEWIFY